MSPRVIALLVVILLVIFAGIALTMKKATDKRRERTAAVVPAKAGIQGKSGTHLLLGSPPPRG